MKKLLSALLTAILLLQLLCIGAFAEPAHEPVTMLAYWGWDTAAFEAAFHEAYPEVELNVVTIATNNMSEYFLKSLTNGDIPDIYVTTVLPEKADQQAQLLDLSDEAFINNYRDTALDEVEADGSIYLLPSASTIGGLYYNKTLAEEYGIELPQSFEELVALKDTLAEIPTNPDLQKFKDANAAKYDSLDLTISDGVEAMRTRMDLAGHIWNLFWNLGATDFFGTPDGEEWKEDFLAGEATAVGNLEPVMRIFEDYVDAGFIQAQDIGNNFSNPTFMIGGALVHSCASWSAYHWESDEYGVWDYGILPFLAEEGGDNMLSMGTVRYYGLSKALAEPGNEQKLEDAKKVLAFLSTEEGQTAWATLNYGTEKEQVNNQYYSPIRGTEIAEDSPIKEVEELLDAGYVQPIVSCYGAWEDIVTSFADCLYAVVRGEMTGDEALAELDRINEERLTEGGVYLAEAEETLSAEDTVRLLGIAFAEATDADAALISLAGTERCSLANAAASFAPLYAGPISESTVTMITPNNASDLQLLTMTGAELKALAEAGFDKAEDGSEIFPYQLVTRDGAEPADEAVCTVVIPAGGAVSTLLEGAADSGVRAVDAVRSYVTELGSVSADRLIWE